MAIGINWKDIWKPVWKNIWSQGSGSTYEATLEHGTYTFTGQDALIDYAANLDYGTYTFNGQDVTFTRTYPQAYSVNLDHGVYTFRGMSITRTYSGEVVTPSNNNKLAISMKIGV